MEAGGRAPQLLPACGQEGGRGRILEALEFQEQSPERPRHLVTGQSLRGEKLVQMWAPKYSCHK